MKVKKKINKFYKIYSYNKLISLLDEKNKS